MTEGAKVAIPLRIDELIELIDIRLTPKFITNIIIFLALYCNA
jgi:hypothetical protein